MAEKIAKSVKAALKAEPKAEPKAAPKPEPKPDFVRYVTTGEYAGRLIISGLRPTMPTVPGPCHYKVPAADVDNFEATREFKGGIVVRVD